MALGQPLDGICEPVHLHLPDDRARNLRGALVLYELADLRGVGVRAYRLVEARRVPQRALQVANVLYRPAEPPSHVLVGGLVLHLGGELVVSAGHLPDLVAPMHRYPYGAALVGHRPLYLLATLTTSLRFFSMSLCLAPLSPALARLERSISSACVSSVPLSMWAK